MNGQGDTQPVAVTSTTAVGTEVASASHLAEMVRDRWRRGERPDVVAVLTEHPELRRYRSVVLDLACEEYQHRLAQGESLDADRFSEQFPSMQKSLYLLLEVHRLLEHDPQFRTGCEPTPWPESGTCFLGFYLLAELGRGTFGRVFLASEPALGNRLVALKVAPQGAQEAEIVGKLRHANVVPIYSIQEDRNTGLTAFCMPYLGRTTLCDVRDRAFADGHPPADARVIVETLQDLSEAGDLDVRQPIDQALTQGSYVNAVIHLMAQLADALAYTHARGVCHRDLKPSNVLLTLEGRPLLLDFNLSMEGQQSVRRVGGTLPYMAPEQLRLLLPEADADPAHADPRSDIFSLGVIFYELLCGRLPFGTIPWDGTLDEVAICLLDRQRSGPDPTGPQNRQIDRPLARLVEQCLAFDPANRPASAEALAAVLHRELSPFHRARRWARNHPFRTVGLGLLSILFLLGGMLGAMSLRTPGSLRQFHDGQAYAHREKYALAADAFTEAIRLDPDFDEAFLARAQVYRELGQYEKSLKDVRTVQQRAPSGRLLTALGYCYMKMGRQDNAAECWRQALSMGYRDPAVLNNLGLFYLIRARYDESEKCLKEALLGDDNLRVAHLNMITLYFNGLGVGRPIPADAFRHVRRTITLGPPHSEAYLCAASLLLVLPPTDNSRLQVDSHRRLALDCLRQAVAHGVNPEQFKDLSFLEPLANTNELREILAISPGKKKQSPPIDRLVNPLD